MQTWAIISQKGGQGKTTLATGFAVEATRDGAAVVILDTDDRQGTASYWENARPTDDITVVNTGIAVLPLNLAKAAKGMADLVIIDTPANSRDIATEAARAADFVLIPVVPRAFDIASVLQTVKQIRQEGTPFAVVLSLVKHAGSEADDTAASFVEMGVRVLSARTYDRKDFSNAAALGRAPTEYDPKGKAAAELRAVYAETKRLSELAIKQADRVVA
jgi:chromosome partitioning protein